MNILIQTRPSNGASALAHYMNEQGHNALLRSPSSTTSVRSSTKVVNWGCTGGGVTPHINSFGAVSLAVNKRRAFIHLMLGNVRVPAWTDGPSTKAFSSPVNDTDSIWLARESLTSSGGEGIRIIRKGETWGDAPLFVQYVPKLIELRGHVVGDRVMLRQKLAPNGTEMSRDQHLIRSGSNGWVFGMARISEERQAEAQEFARKAVAALGLSFGAVDFIIGRDDGEFYALEVNTAPGIQCEPTAKFYGDNIIDMLETGNGR